MSIQMILLPVFVQVALTFAVLFALGAVRGRAIREKAVGREAVEDDTVFPPAARRVANNFRNQFEIPVLFYVLTALALFTRKADIVFVVLAWVIVLSRVVHAYVHCTSNDIRLRFPAYAVGVGALLLMWVLFAAAILLNV